MLNLEAMFTHHAPKGDQIERYLKLRNAAKEFAYLIAENTPQSAEQTTAIRHLQQAVMFANASIAINE